MDMIPTFASHCPPQPTTGQLPHQAQHAQSGLVQWAPEGWRDCVEAAALGHMYRKRDDAAHCSDCGGEVDADGHFQHCLTTRAKAMLAAIHAHAHMPGWVPHGWVECAEALAGGYTHLGSDNLHYCDECGCCLAGGKHDSDCVTVRAGAMLKEYYARFPQERDAENQFCL